MDIVYILGKNSPWSNNEIRYSLRSVSKFLKNVGQIFIVGERPNFISDKVIHIPTNNPYEAHESAIAYNVLEACESSLVGDKFLLIHDDHFITREFDAENFPYFHKGQLAEFFINRGDDEYHKALINSYEYLLENKHETFNYDIHTPFIVEKRKMFRVLSYVDWESKEYVLKSLYCNVNRTRGIEAEDCKINKNRYSLDELAEIAKNHAVVSIGDSALRGNTAANKRSNIKTFLSRFYNEPSPYECY